MRSILYSMKIKEQTRKLAVGCSKHCFEVVDETDEVSNHTYGKATLRWFEEIFEEYQSIMKVLPLSYPLYKKAYHTSSKAGYDRFLYFS